MSGQARAHVIVSGMVQGVGYRYFVKRAAAKYGLTGWVKNLPHGEVELEAEGERGRVEALLAELWTGSSYASVRNIETAWLPPSGTWQNFDIVF